MRIMSSLLAAAACLAAGAAQATSFMGDYTISAHNSGDGLLIETLKVANLGTGFTLANVGDSHSYQPLFKIWTDETTVNAGEDTVAKPISVSFAFTAPEVFGGSVDGNTVGQASLFGFYQNGLLSWDNGGVATFGFGNGGLLQVALSDNLVFNSGAWWGLDEGKKHGAKVDATFTLLRDSAPVPEPAHWAMMIAGFGLVGGALRHGRGRGLHPGRA